MLNACRSIDPTHGHRTVRGTVLVARGTAASRLRDRADISPADPELHPRTAVGIDRDRRLVLLLAADGRSGSSSGLTPAQLAETLASLGSEDALDLDGGGSSTMVAPDPTGTTTGALDAPSDGAERPVPNGLVFQPAP